MKQITEVLWTILLLINFCTNSSFLMKHNLESKRWWIRWLGSCNSMKTGLNSQILANPSQPNHLGNKPVGGSSCQIIYVYFQCLSRQVQTYKQDLRIKPFKTPYEIISQMTSKLDASLQSWSSQSFYLVCPAPIYQSLHLTQGYFSHVF